MTIAERVRLHGSRIGPDLRPISELLTLAGFAKDADDMWCFLEAYRRFLVSHGAAPEEAQHIAAENIRTGWFWIGGDGLAGSKLARLVVESGYDRE